MAKKTIKDIDLNGKRVFVRVDFNVPLDDKGKVSDNTRIVRALPTIKYLIDHNAKVILASHLGNPKTDEDKKRLTMDSVKVELQKVLGKEVKKLDDSVGEVVRSEVSKMKEGDVILLENTRFHKGEKKKDPDYSKELAELADIAVNDAFGTAHRAHASNCGVGEYIPVYAGFLMEKEIDMIGKTLENPERPFVAILGGAKVSSKIGVIENLLPKVDKLLVGGAMIFTFFKAMGYKTGDSLVEEDKIEVAKNILDKAKSLNKDIVFPIDVVIADDINENVNTKICSIENIPNGMKGLDIGPDSIKKFKEQLKDAKTVIWNGPMGVFEIDKFAKGTIEVAKSLAELDNAKTIIGGGDSAAAVNKFHLDDKMTHISTGGGASLEYMEGKELPGIAIIEEK